MKVGGSSGGMKASSCGGADKKKKQEEEQTTPHAMQDQKKANMKAGSLGGGPDSFVSGSK